MIEKLNIIVTLKDDEEIILRGFIGKYLHWKVIERNSNRVLNIVWHVF